MSYIGQAALKNSELKRFDVTSSTSATHVLSWTTPNEQSLFITINGVKQQDDAYSIAGSPTTITLTDALVATDKMEVIGVLDIGVITTPGDNTVSTATLGDNAVTTAKLADSINTEITANTAKTGITSGQASAITANTAKVTNATHTGDVTGATALTIATDAVDIAMLSATGTADATTFLRGDNAWAAVAGSDNTPAFQARLSSGQSCAASSWVKLACDTEVFDTDGAYDNSTNYRFTVPVGEAGTYIFWFGTQFNAVASGVATNTVLYVNGSFELRSRTANGYIQVNMSTHHNHLDSSMMELDVGDYVELYALQHGSGAATAQYEETYFGGMKVAGTS